MDHNHNPEEGYAFVVVADNTVVGVVQIQVLDHMMDFVDSHMVEMDEDLDSIQQVHHHIHNEHHSDTFVVVAVVVDE